MENSGACFSSHQIKVFAESVGIKNLPYEAADLISQAVSTKLKQIIQKAIAFQNHSHHAQLTTGDIAYALKWVCKDTQIGVSASTYAPFWRFASQDREVFVAAEPVLDLQGIVEAVPKVPREVCIIKRWLPTHEVTQAGCTAAPEELVSSMPVRPTPFRSSEIVQLAPLQTHKCSAEQQRFYLELTEACVGLNEGLRSRALNSCSQDPAVAQLLPHLCIFIAEGVKLNVVKRNMRMLIYLMRMIKELTDNPHIFLKAFVHVLIPQAITCVVSRKLSQNASLEKCWVLREFSAKVVVKIVDLCHDDINNLRERTIRVYQKPLFDSAAGLFTIYGAMYGLKLLAKDIAKKVITLRHGFLLSCLEKRKNSLSNNDKLAAFKIHSLLQEMRGNEGVSKPSYLSK